MGVLYTVVLAHRDDVKLMGDASLFHERFSDAVSTKLLGHVTISQLFSILDSAPFDMDEWIGKIAYAEDELWIHEFPPRSIQQLAALSPMEQKLVARLWFDTEEIQMFFKVFAPRSSYLQRWFNRAKVQQNVNDFYNDSLKVTETVLFDMCQLAKKAQADRKTLFLHNTL